MITTVKRNWKEIKRVMLLSQQSHYSWLEYSQKISNGLSNNILTKRGNGDITFFVERLNQYALLSRDYLKIAKNMSDEQLDFIDNNRNFLKTIN